jgi:hypothetical protein
VKVLVAGWFSFPGMGATAGDLLTRDVVCGWLDEAGRSYDVALADPFPNGVDWQTVDPGSYSDVVFVCGPFGNGWPIPEFVARFAGRRLVGVNLSMLEPIDTWNPFDVLLERDSSACVRPDITMLRPAAHVPVAGIVLVHDQKEYPNGLHDAANSAIARLIASRAMAAVRIDTRLDINATGLRTPAEVESLIARMDVVVTTRLHGLVLAIKNGVPAVAIDPIAGGAKLLRQASVLEWPICFTADGLDDDRLAGAFEYGLTAAARVKARECAERARTRLTGVRERFLEAFDSPVQVG